jgi:Secretion system C-terminal sorting domain
VYPNPTQEVLHLNIEKVNSFEWKIMDVLGKIVLRGSSSNSIALKNLQESTYLLYTHTKNNTYIES